MSDFLPRLPSPVEYLASLQRTYRNGLCPNLYREWFPLLFQFLKVLSLMVGLYFVSVTELFSIVLLCSRRFHPKSQVDLLFYRSTGS